MKTNQPVISANKVRLWFVLTNTLLLAFTVYVHALLSRHGLQSDHFFESFQIWVLVIFKLVGANLILGVIFSDFKMQ